MAAIAVGLGAFGAHGLKALLKAPQLQTFEIGVRYQFYHAFALLFTGLLVNKYPSKLMNLAGFLFVLGIICFSGSLYLLATHSIIGLNNYQWLGPITPIGGTFFIIGWLFLLLGIAGAKPAANTSNPNTYSQTPNTDLGTETRVLHK